MSGKQDKKSKLSSRIIYANKFTEAGLMGGKNDDDIVEGLCQKYVVVKDEFQRDILMNDPKNDVRGVIRKNCNNYGSYDNLIKNAARSQMDIPAYNGIATFIVTLTPEPLKKLKSELIHEGTLERFDVDANEIDAQRSAAIFDAIKHSKLTPEERQSLGEKQKKVFSNILHLLQDIGGRWELKDGVRIYDKTVVYIVDDYYYEITDKLKQQVQEAFEIDKVRGQFMHSMQIRNLNLICKYAARIALVHGRKTITKQELEESYNIVMESMSNLIEKLELFEKDAEEKHKWIRDCKNVLAKDAYTKTEINAIMMKYWGLGETNTIQRLKEVKDCFEPIEIRELINGVEKKTKKRKLKI